MLFVVFTVRSSSPDLPNLPDLPAGMTPLARTTVAGDDDFNLLLSFRVRSQDELLQLEALVAPLGAELAVTAPCPVPIVDVRGGWASFCDPSAELFRAVGLGMFRHAATAPQVASLDAVCRDRIAQAEAAMARQCVDPARGEFTLREVSTRGTNRVDLLLSLPDNPLLNEWCRAGPWMPLVRQFLGESAALDVSVIYSRPGAANQAWHADGGHIGHVAGWNGDGHDDPYALCVFVPLLDMRPEYGATQFWPGSHKFDGLLGFGQAAPMLRCTLDALVHAGDAVLYDYRLLHRGLANTSEGVERRLLQLLWRTPSYTEARNYGSQSVFS